MHSLSPQIGEQMSGPDTQILSPKKTWFFPHKKEFPKFFWLLFTFILCNFSLRTLKYFQKNFKLSIKTLKNLPQKLLIIDPNPFISHSSPDHSPELIFHIMKSRNKTSVLLAVYVLPSDPTHYWGNIFTRWPNWKKNC